MKLWLGHTQKSKFLFWTRKWPTSLGFSIFCKCFLLFSFFSSPFLFAAVIDLLLSLLAVKKGLRKHHWDKQFYHGVAMCSGRKFYSEFFTWHFWAPLGQLLWSVIIAILLGHEHLIWVALPLPPIQCCLQTVKEPLQGVRTNCAFQHWMGERGYVWVIDLWQWLSIHDKLRSRNYAFGSIMKELEFWWKKGCCYGMIRCFGLGFLGSVQKEPW